MYYLSSGIIETLSLTMQKSKVKTVTIFKRVSARTLAIFRQPPLSSVNNIFTLPFALNVWIMMIAMLFVFTVALIFLTWTTNRLKGEKTQLSTAFDTVTMVLGAICQQGKEMSCPAFTRVFDVRIENSTREFVKANVFVSSGVSITIRSVPARLATFTLFLSAVFLFTSYAASIVILLESTSQTITSLEDLAEKPITFSVQDTKHNYVYFNVLLLLSIL